MECFINAYVHSVQNLTGSVKGEMGSDPPDFVCSTNRWARQVGPVLLQVSPIVDKWRQESQGLTSGMARKLSS